MYKCTNLSLLAILAVVVMFICYPVSAQAVPNNACETATPIFNGDTGFVNFGGGNFSNSLCGNSGSHVWFSYTATCTGDLTLSTCDQANYDTTLALYDDADCDDVNNALFVGDPPNITCNDDGVGCGGFTSQLTGPVISGNQYLFRIGGFSGNQGTGTISVVPGIFCIVGGPPGSTACGNAQEACQAAVDALPAGANHGAVVSACAQAANPALDSGEINEECHSCVVSEKASKKKVGTNCGPDISCPCFDASDIDLQPEVLTSAGPPICEDQLPDFILLQGLRTSDGSFWGAQSLNTIPFGFSQCILIDDLNGLFSIVSPITDAENQACIDIFLNSQMFGLNNCPP